MSNEIKINCSFACDIGLCIMLWCLHIEDVNDQDLVVFKWVLYSVDHQFYLGNNTVWR